LKVNLEVFLVNRKRQELLTLVVDNKQSKKSHSVSTMTKS